MPDSHFNESKYSLGGCCVSDNDPTLECIECGWKGEIGNSVQNKKKVVHMVKLESTEGMSHSDLDEYAKRLWIKLTNNGKGWKNNGDSKS